jgi:hypothetical protein
MDISVNNKPTATVHCHSPIDHRHRRTGAWERLWDAVFPGFAQVVVCELRGNPRVHLLGLCERGEIRFSSEHPSVEEAKRFAEDQYRGLAGTWRGALGA